MQTQTQLAMYKNYLQQSSKETITNIKQLINITVKSKRAIKAVILPVCYTLSQLINQIHQLR